MGTQSSVQIETRDGQICGSERSDKLIAASMAFTWWMTTVLSKALIVMTTLSESRRQGGHF